MNKIKLLVVFCVGLTCVNAVELTAALTAQTEDCQKGHVQSCYEVGIALSSGENAEDQEKKNLGLSYVRRACTSGEKKACDYLAENYFKDGHYLAAKPLYEDACTRKVVSACLGLGTIFRDGDDVRQNDVTSRQYYEKACDLGSKDACINVAIIYRGGFGVKKERAMEKKYYQKACNNASQIGCDSYKRMDNEDKGIEEPGLWEEFKSLFN